MDRCWELFDGARRVDVHACVILSQLLGSRLARMLVVWPGDGRRCVVYEVRLVKLSRKADGTLQIAM